VTELNYSNYNSW